MRMARSRYEGSRYFSQVSAGSRTWPSASTTGAFIDDPPQVRGAASSSGERVSQLADAFDPEPPRLPRLQEAAARHADARGRARQDEVAGRERHARGELR